MFINDNFARILEINGHLAAHRRLNLTQAPIVLLRMLYDHPWFEQRLLHFERSLLCPTLTP